MLIAAAAILIAGAVLFTLGVRKQDLPAEAPVSPFQHLEERKAQIYENLRDLQFEFRVGKLSDADYQKTKTELQTELAKVMAAIDQHKGSSPPPPATAPAPIAVATAPIVNICPHCNAKFDRALKFCGECGKPMTEVVS